MAAQSKLLQRLYQPSQRILPVGRGGSESPFGFIKSQCMVTDGSRRRKLERRILMRESGDYQRAMDLNIDSNDAEVLRRVLRTLLPQLQQEAYASESGVGSYDWSSDERVVQEVVQSLEARLSRQDPPGQMQG